MSGSSNNAAKPTLAEVEAKLKAIGIDVECNDRRSIKRKSSVSKKIENSKDPNTR